ncbi:MAG TPA: hypothetical protein ENI64_07155, partial [Gammaproteobacteria bacterium]|nr:hypothetical protein [Gammaproteobacteria bacterium]
PAVIAAKIYDYTDVTSSAIIDFSGFLDGAGGNAVVATLLSNTITQDQILTGNVYVVGKFSVPVGLKLTLQAGAKVRILPGMGITVNGSLQVLGTPANPVIFTSSSSIPVRGEWAGIKITSTSNNILIDNAIIQYAVRGVHFNNANGTLSNSRIQENTYGVYIDGNVTPLLSSNAIINNTFGIYLQGSGNDLTNPQPVITGNDLHGNPSGSLYVNNYGTGSSLVIDAKGNWWGKATPDNVTDIVYAANSAAVIDASLPLLAATKGVQVTGITLTEAYFSPNGDTVKDATVFSATLSAAASWTVDVNDINAQTVRSFTGSGISVSASWDGLNNIATLQPDGRYTFVLSTTLAGQTNLTGYYSTELDNTVPVSVISNLPNGSIFQNVASQQVVGSAYDQNFTNFELEYGTGTSPTVYTTISGIQTVVRNLQALGTLMLLNPDGTPVPIMTNGQYTVRLRVTDAAGNVGIQTRLVTIDNLAFSNVIQTTDNFNPGLGQSLGYTFDLNLPGTVTLDVYPEQAGTSGTPIRTITVTYTAAGTYSLTWDGRDDNGVLAPDEAYVIVLTASDGTRLGVYQPVPPAAKTTLPPTLMSTTANAFSNTNWTTDVVVPSTGRVQLALQLGGVWTYPDGAGLILTAGTHTLQWDGRDPATGKAYTGTFKVQVYFISFSNSTVQITGGAPVISGAATNIEVKSDPYTVYLSYGQFTKFRYNLDRAATVTIKLLPPGIYNPSDAKAITVISNVSQAAGDHVEVSWSGVDTNDATGKTLLIGDYAPAIPNPAQGSAEGAYTFVIQATSTAGVTTTKRGTLSVYR